jgi:hypothetical protein
VDIAGIASRPLSPRRIMEPLPNCLSICESAAVSAFSLLGSRVCESAMSKILSLKINGLVCMNVYEKRIWSIWVIALPPISKGIKAELYCIFNQYYQP